MIALVPSIMLFAVFLFLEVKLPKKFFRKSARFFDLAISAELLCLTILILAQAFLITINWVYSLTRFGLLQIINSKLAATYLALVVSLIVLAYIPEKLGYYFLRLLERFMKNRVEYASKYILIVKLIRFKLWIYFISFGLLLVSSLELFTNRTLIERAIWSQFKPVVLQAVVTVIAFDRFLKLLYDEWSGLKMDFIKIRYKLWALKIFIKNYLFE